MTVYDVSLVASSDRDEATRALLETQLFDYGITRVARLTGLDIVGIPVYSAVRPRATTLSVSAGKGLTETTAWISAVMESIETETAEKFRPEDRFTVPAERLSLNYPLSALPQAKLSAIDSSTPLQWVAAEDAVSGAAALVPFLACGLRGNVVQTRHTLGFTTSSNGVAAGIESEAAARHALSELIERHSLSSWLDPDHGATLRFGTDSHCSPLREIVKGLEEDGCEIVTLVRLGLAGHWVAASYLSSPDMPQLFGGSAADVNVRLAAEKATLEAFQSRASVISGLRDDINREDYASARRRIKFDSDRFETMPEASIVERKPHSSQTIAAAIGKMTGMPVLKVMLSPSDAEVRVVQLLAPGLSPAVGLAAPIAGKEVQYA